MENYKRPNRLHDIIALIQLLSNCEKTNRSLKGIQAEGNPTPLSAPGWEYILQEHPEFFRYNPHSSSKFNVSLLFRHQKQKRNPNSDARLTLEEQELLIRTATDLWERQQKGGTTPEPVAVVEEKQNQYLSWINDISKGRLEQTIGAIQQYLLDKNDKDHGIIMTNLSARWNSLKREKLKGSISEADAQLSENQIINALVEVVYELKENG